MANGPLARGSTPPTSPVRPRAVSKSTATAASTHGNPAKRRRDSSTDGGIKQPVRTQRDESPDTPKWAAKKAASQAPKGLPTPPVSRKSTMEKLQQQMLSQAGRSRTSSPKPLASHVSTMWNGMPVSIPPEAFGNRGSSKNTPDSSGNNSRAGSPFRLSARQHKWEKPDDDSQFYNSDGEISPAEEYVPPNQLKGGANGGAPAGPQHGRGASPVKTTTPTLPARTTTPLPARTTPPPVQAPVPTTKAQSPLNKQQQQQHSPPKNATPNRDVTMVDAPPQRKAPKSVVGTSAVPSPSPPLNNNSNNTAMGGSSPHKVPASPSPAPAQKLPKQTTPVQDVPMADAQSPRKPPRSGAGIPVSASSTRASAPLSDAPSNLSSPVGLESPRSGHKTPRHTSSPSSQKIPDSPLSDVPDNLRTPSGFGSPMSALSPVPSDFDLPSGGAYGSRQGTPVADGKFEKKKASAGVQPIVTGWKKPGAAGQGQSPIRPIASPLSADVDGEIYKVAFPGDWSQWQAQQAKRGAENAAQQVPPKKNNTKKARAAADAGGDQGMSESLDKLQINEVDPWLQQEGESERTWRRRQARLQAKMQADINGGVGTRRRRNIESEGA